MIGGHSHCRQPNRSIHYVINHRTLPRPLHHQQDVPRPYPHRLRFLFNSGTVPGSTWIFGMTITSKTSFTGQECCESFWRPDWHPEYCFTEDLNAERLLALFFRSYSSSLIPPPLFLLPYSSSTILPPLYGQLAKLR